jgi:hypothetical protein
MVSFQEITHKRIKLPINAKKFLIKTFKKRKKDKKDINCLFRK